MKTIYLASGDSVLVDDTDYDYLQQWKWHRDYGHAKRISDGIAIWMHNEVARRMGLLIEPNQEIDHIRMDNIIFDNTRDNLRVATRSQNLLNRRKQHNRSSIYKGVSYNTSTNKWRAAIHKNYRKIHLGYFNRETDAALAYNEAALSIFGEFARLNVIGTPDLVPQK